MTHGRDARATPEPWFGAAMTTAVPSPFDVWGRNLLALSRGNGRLLEVNEDSVEHWKLQ